MKQIFVTNPKGGCGKTTISTQLAGYFANSGAKILLADHDAQRSSSDWFKSRPISCKNIQLCIGKIEQPLDTAGIDYVIHDMPAVSNVSDFERIIQPQDLIIIPIMSSPTDIKAALRFIMGLNRTGLLERHFNIGIVANRVKTNTNYAKVQQKFLDKLDLPLITSLRDTQNYIHAMSRGLTVFDLPPSKTRKETEQWAPLFEWITR